MATPSYIDCCAEPGLDWVLTLHQSTHDQETLLRCTACRAFWFHRFHEYADWAGGNDDLTSWYSRLTATEGERLRDSANPSGEDLSFLRTRPSWMDDAQGIHQVEGAPDRPYS